MMRRSLILLVLLSAALFSGHTSAEEIVPRTIIVSAL